MEGKNHIICAAASGVIYSAVYFENFPMVLCAIGASVLGGLIPDIDLPSSTMGKKVKIIAKTINKAFGHRTITHSGLWLIPLIIYYFKSPNMILGGYIVGFTSHLISDSMTSGGLPWLWPFSKTRFRLTKFKSGQIDLLFVLLTIIIMAIGVYISFDFKTHI